MKFLVKFDSKKTEYNGVYKIIKIKTTKVSPFIVLELLSINIRNDSAFKRTSLRCITILNSDIIEIKHRSYWEEKIK